jgi:hypothetical protein
MAYRRQADVVEGSAMDMAEPACTSSSAEAVRVSAETAAGRSTNTAERSRSTDWFEEEPPIVGESTDGSRGRRGID